MSRPGRFREVVLNAAQLAAVLAVTILKKTKIFLEWGRGTGKSFILAFFMKKMVEQMPGASFALVGSTYQQILSRTLPSTKRGLADLGIYEGYDYVVGKNGAKYGFASPIYSPDKWDNVIHFSNGAVFQLVSLDNPNSGRGLNSFGIIGDEASLFDPEKLFNNVKTTNRAKEARFENATLLGAEIYASSTPLTKKGRWFTDMEEVAKRKPNKYAFIKASALVNKMNLRADWFEEMKDESPSDLIYNAEILNIRPREILNGFYPQLNPDRHYYTDYNNEYLESITGNYTKASFNCLQDNDIDKQRPLILSIDWGTFLSAVISQQLPNKYRVLKSMWASQSSESQDLEDLVNDFAAYYEPLPTKAVHLYYGHDGNARVRRGTNETYGDMLVRLLQAKGWTVYDKSKGKPVAPHNDKYILINMMLKGSRSRYPGIEINEHNNADLIIGLERAEAAEGKNGIQKVKKDERNISMRQEHTTHLPDAFDIPIYAIYKHLLKPEREHWDLPMTL
ncbi:terminase large subunit domain-containing protein [Leptobacterium sp. I13]|uniref:terminase large subunit domain-containing protein n=1 Tax=Leptobacterium meishanense TaxID=3128904 RepID=UPI0030EEC6A9